MIDFRETVINDLYARASATMRTIAFPDALDIRVLQACNTLFAKHIAQPVLIGNSLAIHQLADSHAISLDGIKIIDPQQAQLQLYVDALMLQRKDKDLQEQEARELLGNPLYFAGIALHLGIIDGCVAGNLSTTAQVIKAGLWTVGKAPGIQTISSYFLMLLQDKVLAFADAGIVPSPNSSQLCDIAYTTSQSTSMVMQWQPKLAFLSFSTKNSANHEDVTKIQQAFALFRDRYPAIIADGELQADAALVPDIALKKAPDSPLKGNANILIFPDLDAGNIAYKLIERLAGAKAIGPIIQGLQKPYCDLSRGCSAEDIVSVAAICSLMA